MISLDPFSDAGAVHPGFLLVLNNAQPHVAIVCRQLLQHEGTDITDCPPELSNALVQIREKIPQDTIIVSLGAGHYIVRHTCNMQGPYKLLSTI